MTADKQPISEKERGIFGRIHAANQPHRDAENEAAGDTEAPPAEQAMLRTLAELITGEGFASLRSLRGGALVLEHLSTFKQVAFGEEIRQLLRTDPQRASREVMHVLAREGFAPLHRDGFTDNGMPPRAFTADQLREFIAEQPGGQFVRVKAGVIAELAKQERARGAVEDSESRSEVIAKLSRDNQELQRQLKENSVALHSTKAKLREVQAIMTQREQPTRFATRDEQQEQHLHRRESIELVTAMLEPAGFALIRDEDDETAMWMQQLPSRPQVQVFFQFPVEMQDRSAAEVYAEIRRQTGAM
jgi:hypothetical protein